jgi:hypothetical protein
VIDASPVVGVDSLAQPLRAATVAITARAEMPTLRARDSSFFIYSFSFVLDSYSSRLVRTRLGLLQK